MSGTLTKRERWMAGCFLAVLIAIGWVTYSQVAQLKERLVEAEGAMGLGLTSMALSEVLIHKKNDMARVSAELRLGTEEMLSSYRFEPLAPDLRYSIDAVDRVRKFLAKAED